MCQDGDDLPSTRRRDGLRITRPHPTSPSRVFYIVGTVSYDYLLYPTSAADDAGQSSFQLRARTGGSTSLVAQLLTATRPVLNLNIQIHKPIGLREPPSGFIRHDPSSILELSRRDASSEKFQVVSSRPIGNALIWHSPPLDGLPATDTDSSTVVLSGSGNASQNIEAAVEFIKRARPRLVIYHMTLPLAVGKIWHSIRNGPPGTDDVPDPDRLAVIVNASDLRAEGILLGQDSWERTCEDFVKNIGSNGRLSTIVTCPNLIVRFGNEGVIHHRGRDAVNPKLYFCSPPSQQVDGRMIGLDSAFTAGFALGFPDIERGIRLGIAAANTMSKVGFVTDDDGTPNYPIHQLAETLGMDHRLATPSVVSCEIPSKQISTSGGDNFTIFDSLTGDSEVLARQIVTDGPDDRLPMKQYGQFRSLIRSEQENVGSIVEIMKECLGAGDSVPTCIAVSGHVGSGKKFLARHTSEHACAASQRRFKHLVCDMRVMRSMDLIHCCQTIRDNSAENMLTVVTLENAEQVDSSLLAEICVLMRDGRFSEKGAQHRVGRCLLMFLINDESADQETPASVAEIIGNTHGVVRILGPNRVNKDDKLYPIRRALMLRQLLLDRHPHLSRDGTIQVDDAVLHALLFVPSYKNGLRSLDKIITASRLSHKTKFDVAALPPEEQIQTQVDGKTFMSRLRTPKLPPALRDTLAVSLFETYKHQRRLMAVTDKDREDLKSDASMADWGDLDGYLKESTRAQADDIPRKLRAVRCFMTPDANRRDPFVAVPEFTFDDLRMLSEMEHERFNAERLQRQWRMGPRDSKHKTTPFLVPWGDLTQEWKDVDRVMVECVPRVLNEAGWYIYRMKEDETPNATGKQNGRMQDAVAGGGDR